MLEKSNALETKVVQQLKETKELRYIVQTKFNSSSTNKKTEIGRNALEYLKRNKLITSFVPTQGDSVLEDKEYLHVHGLKEQELVDCILSKLKNILKPRAVVSSENFPWLMISSNRLQDKQKPDVFITHRATFKKKNCSSRSSVLCGVPAHRAFYQGLGIIDFKVKADNKAFGELVVHVEHLYANIRAHSSINTLATVKCALASREGIWLVTFSGSTPINMIQMKWTDKGSACTLSSFFREENRTALILDELLVSMKLEARSFLGAGATGCVFEVSPTDESRPRIRGGMALKVVVGKKNIASLSNEYMHNNLIFSKKKDVAVVKAVAFEVCNDEGGAGMLMEEAGSGALVKSRRAIRINIKRALDALASVHSTEYHHGDARIANLLICSDVYKWCDLQFAYRHEAEALKRSSFGGDIVTLMTLLGKEFPFDSAEFMDLLDGYVKTQDTAPFLDLFLTDDIFEFEPPVAESSDEVDGGSSDEVDGGQDQASGHAVSRLKHDKGTMRSCPAGPTQSTCLYFCGHCGLLLAPCCCDLSFKWTQRSCQFVWHSGASCRRAVLSSFRPALADSTAAALQASMAEGGASA